MKNKKMYLLIMFVVITSIISLKAFGTQTEKKDLCSTVSCKEDGPCNHSYGNGYACVGSGSGKSCSTYYNCN